MHIQLKFQSCNKRCGHDLCFSNISSASGLSHVVGKITRTNSPQPLICIELKFQLSDMVNKYDSYFGRITSATSLSNVIGNVTKTKFTLTLCRLRYIQIWSIHDLDTQCSRKHDICLIFCQCSRRTHRNWTIISPRCEELATCLPLIGQQISE